MRELIIRGTLTVLLLLIGGLFSGASLAVPVLTGVEQLAQLDWMKGCWTGDIGGREYTEHWMAPAGGTMMGMSRMVAGDRTVEHEFIQIRRMENGEIHYIAHPSGQKTASFKLVKAGADEAVFENPAHDFPQRIIYRRTADGGLTARIEGTRNGKERGVDYPLRRARCD